MREEKTERAASLADWTFLSNHGHVLLCIAQEPAIRLRDVADRVGITERAVQRIVAELEEAGYLSRAREGRRNHYELHTDRPFRHPVVAHRDVSLLLRLFVSPATALSTEAMRHSGAPGRSL
jgi:predicted ArsR family transcriptional regulator